MSANPITITGTVETIFGVSDPTATIVVTLVNVGSGLPTVPTATGGPIVLTELQQTIKASGGIFTFQVWGDDVIVSAGASNTYYNVLYTSSSRDYSASVDYLFTGQASINLATWPILNPIPAPPVAIPSGAVLLNPTGEQVINVYPLEVSGIISPTSNTALSGFIQMANTDTIDWRNNANSGDLPLGVNSSDQLIFNGNLVSPATIDWVNVKNHGALGNALVAPLNGNINAHSTTLTIGTSIQSGYPSAKFTAAMVGWTVKVPFAGTGVTDLYDTVAAYVSPTQVTLTNGNQTAKNLTSIDVSWWSSGSSDSTAINAAISAQTAPFVLYLPSGGYPLTASIVNNPYLIGIAGDGMMATSLITASQSFDAALLSLTDMPWGFFLQGFTTFGRGQVVSVSPPILENGIDLLNAASKSENLVRMTDVRCAISPGSGFHGEGVIVSEFNHCIFDDCGNYNFYLDVNPINSGGGTSCVMNDCYSYDAGNCAYYLNGYAYCSLNACAADSNNLSYWLHNCENVGLYSCGCEVPVSTGAVGYIIDGGKNITLDNCYWTQVNNANNVGVAIKNGATNVIVRNFLSNQPFITPTNDISIQAGCANVIIENLNSTATTPIADAGTNTMIVSGGAITKLQGLTAYGTIAASPDLSVNIGSSTVRFANLYIGNVYAAGTKGTIAKSTGVFGWSSTSDPTGTVDTGISRDSAGVIMMGNGTTDDNTATVDGGNFIGNRYDAKNGTVLVSGDFALSGWGSTSSLAITNLTSKDSGGEVTITSNGSGLGANPTVTLTFHDGSWGHAPAVVACGGSTVGSGIWTVTSVTATRAVFTYIGTPAGSGQTYSVLWNAIGT